MVYSDTATKLGIIQDCEMALFGDSGYGQISGNTNRLLQFTARINRRLDRFTQLAFEADGTWQWDDTNNTDFPIATTNIIFGQRDYTFDITMLEIEKVMIYPSATATVYVPIRPTDIQGRLYSDIAINAPANMGTPFEYDKTSTSTILNPTPNYSASLGIKVIFKRAASYFTSTDTTKVPGFASIFHNYLSRGAALDYAIDRDMPEANNLAVQVVEIEKSIGIFYGRRAADEKRVITNQPIMFL